MTLTLFSGTRKEAPRLGLTLLCTAEKAGAGERCMFPVMPARRSRKVSVPRYARKEEQDGVIIASLLLLLGAQEASSSGMLEASRPPPGC